MIDKINDKEVIEFNTELRRVYAETGISHIDDATYFIAQLHDVVKALRIKNKKLREGQEWISVKIKMPPSEKLVSIVVTNNKACVGFLNSRGEWIIWSLSNSYKTSAMHRVIKWKPLPSPPQDKEL